MTEKEFENLKVGDKVWIITDWFNKSNEGMKAVELEVKGKEEDEQIIQFLGVCFKTDYCSLTKSEAWENEIKRCEEALKSQEQEVEKDRKALDRYKAELAKAKEEERRKEWYVSYKEQAVAKLPLVMDSDAEAEIFETEQEAYEALAEYYTKKAEEAWIKSGAKFYGGYKTVALLNHIKPIEGSQMVHATSVWQRGCYCGKYSTKNTESEWRISKKSLFDTEAEAYAKMEKETPQDVRAEDCADEISERFKAEADAQALEAATRRQV